MSFFSVVRFVTIAALVFMGSLLTGCQPAGGDGLGTEGEVTHTGSRGPELTAGSGGVSGPRTGNGINVRIDASTSGSGGAGGSPNTETTPTSDANCGAQTSNTTRVPTDVMLVFDCSTSMVPMWKDFSAAVMQTISTTRDIHWGLKLYPSRGLLPLCDVTSSVEVSISADATSSIETALSQTAPGGLTPTGKAIQMTTAYLQNVHDQSKKAILLATDGEPNCDSDVPTTIKAIGAAKDAGFSVYVVGVGASVGNLDNFAQAGGTGKYYPATSGKELADALGSISKAVASCTFALTSTPPDLSNLAVYLDKNLVPKDTGNGWSLDPGSQSITLSGTYCEKISTSSATTVQVLFGCPGYVAPAVIL